jgi:hypothetical protein
VGYPALYAGALLAIVRIYDASEDVEGDGGAAAGGVVAGYYAQRNGRLTVVLILPEHTTHRPANLLLWLWQLGNRNVV